LGSLIICLTLSSRVTAAQCSNRIPDPKQYLIEAGANLADKATPEALRLIDPRTTLPDSVLFQTLAAADQMAQCIREQRYKEGLSILRSSAGRLLGDHLLENTGFGWIGLAAAPIKYALYKFLNVAASDALDFNIKAYMQARQSGVSHEQIINRAVDCMDDQGWLNPCERTRAGWSPTQHVPGYTPAEVYEFARSIYNAQNSLATLQRDKQIVLSNFQEQIGSAKRATVSPNQLVAAQHRKLLPVDEAGQIPAFLQFRTALLQAINRRDARHLVGILDKDVKLSFGGDYGVRRFIEMWSPYSAQSAIWKELGDVLRLGGTFGYGSYPRDTFWAPYVFTSKGLDAFNGDAAIVDANVPMYAERSSTSRVISTLSYDIVKLGPYDPNPLTEKIGEFSYAWKQIRIADQRTGYVSSRYVRSPLDYRAAFNKIGRAWKLTAFVRGD